MNRRVLFVAYIYPPTGGAGVQRTAKFVKYLPEFGWTPSVLTVANPSVPLIDRSVSADVPVDTLVRRARTWEPGYSWKAAVSDGPRSPGQGRHARRLVKSLAWRLARLVLQPDPQILWLPGAVRQGLRLLREIRHEAIIATAPPFSSFLVGALLSRLMGLPLLLDYRDEWDLSSAYSENRRADLLSRIIQGAMQRRVVRRAGSLVATTRSSADALDGVRRRAGAWARVSCIYNGFDPEDLPRAPAPPRPGKYQLAYVGTLWNLTDVGPLVDAILLLARGRPELAARLELVFAGRRTAPQQQHLERLRGMPCQLIEHPYLDHRRAVEMAQAADGLCVLLADLPGAGRVVPAKVFEYMATGRPILALAPEGELRDILAHYPAARAFSPRDAEGIAQFLSDQIRGTANAKPAAAALWDALPFERRHQAGQMAELLGRLVEEHPVGVPAHRRARGNGRCDHAGGSRETGLPVGPDCRWDRRNAGPTC